MCQPEKTTSADDDTTTNDDNQSCNQSTKKMTKKKKKNPWPDDNNNNTTTSSSYWCCSYWTRLSHQWTYSYMNSIFQKGTRQKKDASIELTLDDLYATPTTMEASLLGEKFWNLYNNNTGMNEKKKKKSQGHFLKTLWYLVAPTFIPAGLCQLVALSSQLAVPICVMKLLLALEESYSSSSNNSSSMFQETILYVILIFVLNLTYAFFNHRQQFLAYQSGIVLRSAILSVIYEKALVCEKKMTDGSSSSGTITNLVATDTQKLFEVMQEGHTIWSCPLAIVIVIVLLFVLIGPTCLVGAFLLVALLPLSKAVMKRLISIRKQRVAVADERIHIITAMLQGMKVTKLNHYEDAFEERVNAARQREMKLVQREQSVWGFTLVLRVFTPVVASAATFVTYVLTTGGGDNDDHILTASITFTIVMLFNMLKFPINQAGQLLSKAALGIQAVHRISHFMNRDDIIPHNENKGNDDNVDDESKCHDDTTVALDNNNLVLQVTNGTFYVGSKNNKKESSSSTTTEDDEESSPTNNISITDDKNNNNDVSSSSSSSSQQYASSSSAFTLSDINFSLARGEVLAVVGQVASGKSTLLNGLLGDVPSSADTRIQFFGTPTTTSTEGNNNNNKNSIAFAGQSPFILSTTVKENILFGLPFHPQRYNDVIEACCLKPDLRLWSAGDETVIGERGVTLSGGQKQRVSIARAVYHCCCIMSSSSSDESSSSNNNSGGGGGIVALLDDPLSALDAGTSQQVFDNLFSHHHKNNRTNHNNNININNSNSSSSLLQNCGVVLVTHAVHVLQRVSQILVLDEGNVLFYGTWEELQRYEPRYERNRAKLDALRSSLQLQEQEQQQGEEQNDDDITIKNVNEDSKNSKNHNCTTSDTTNKSSSIISRNDNDKDNKDESSSITKKKVNKKNAAGEIMTVEEREHGLSSLRVWLLWFTYAGGFFFCIVQALLMMGDRGSYVLIDWWLATWTSSANQSIVVLGKYEFPNQSGGDGRSAQVPYLIVYASLIGIMFVFLNTRSQWVVHGGIRACERVFSNMTHRVLHAPMSYFDTTPLGRILNRFTYDVEQVDITLSQFMSITIIASSWFIAGQIVMITIIPYLALLNAFIMFLYFMVLRHYRWSAADLQRLDAVSRSPIQASMAEGLDGSTTIRAYQKNNYFLNIFHSHINDNSSAMLNFVSSRRWLSVRLESLGSLVTLSACLFIISLGGGGDNGETKLGLSPGIAGLLIVWASNMTTVLNFLINSFSEAEAAITSIERMHSLELLPQEKSMTTIRKEHQVDAAWPRRGLVTFDKVKMRYRPELPLALDGLSFTLQPGERCAVVGRTGAGKSSLTAALFRLVEIEEGTISLDGVDLSVLGLSDVRGRPSSMFILPQDPVLFAGSIQTNLDPFSMHTKKEKMKALILVRFPGASSSINSNSILEEPVEEGGANFSAGEKQLLCLARAMLSKPRLLVLDEATSAVDGTTDEFVQTMLRSQFPDTTMLTIAHRLHTVIDYDTVLVMDQGRAAEYGSPKQLLQNEDGLFTQMVNATGPETAAALKQLVKQ